MRVGEVGNVSSIEGDVVKLGKNDYAFIHGGYKDDMEGHEEPIALKKVKPYTVVSAWRKDIDGNIDYKFYIAKKRGKIIITAGCRYFTSVEDAKSHWRRPVDHSKFQYNEDRYQNRVFTNDQSLKIIDKLLARLKKKGV